MFESKFEAIMSDFNKISSILANSSELSGFKSEGAVKGGEGRC